MLAFRSMNNNIWRASVYISDACKACETFWRSSSSHQKGTLWKTSSSSWEEKESGTITQGKGWELKKGFLDSKSPEEATEG